MTCRSTCATLPRALAAIRMTDRVWAGEASSDVAAEDCLRMAEIVFGGADAIAEAPVVFANCNVNSPLLFDSRMLEGILTYAAAGQAVIITPFLLMGAMAPVSVPAALVQQTVEALAGVALIQLIRPGTPSVMGSFLSTTDMKTGSPTFGGPESAIGLHASGQIARRIGLPWRAGGGTLNASPVIDYQAGYESMNTLQAAFLAGANVVWQSAGWLEGGLVTSLAKFVADVELIDLLQTQFTPLHVDEASLALDAHVEVGHGGHFFGAQHTLERFRECFWRPTVATTENIDRWTRGGRLDHAARAERRVAELLETYEAPPLDDAIEAEPIEFVERRAVELGDPLSGAGVNPGTVGLARGLATCWSRFAPRGRARGSGSWPWSRRSRATRASSRACSPRSPSRGSSSAIPRRSPTASAGASSRWRRASPRSSAHARTGRPAAPRGRARASAHLSRQAGRGRADTALRVAELDPARPPAVSVGSRRSPPPRPGACSSATSLTMSWRRSGSPPPPRRSRRPAATASRSCARSSSQGS